MSEIQSNSNIPRIITYIEELSETIVNLINAKYNNQAIPIYSFEGKMLVVPNIIVPDLIKLYRGSPDITLDDLKKKIPNAIDSINTNDSERPLVRDQKIILEGLVGILNNISTLSGSNYKHGILAILGNLRVFFKRTDVINEVWRIRDNERASPAPAAERTPVTPAEASSTRKDVQFRNSISNISNIRNIPLVADIKTLSRLKSRLQKRGGTIYIQSVPSANLNSYENIYRVISRNNSIHYQQLQPKSTGSGYEWSEPPQDINKFPLENYPYIEIDIKNNNEGYKDVAGTPSPAQPLPPAPPPAASAAAGTPPPAPAPLQKIKVPMPNPINALLGPKKELKPTGPPYYFRITRNTFSAIYRSNQLPKAGETILAQALQVEGGPFWIKADIDVAIPSIDDPSSGTIDMIVCEVPTMKGGRRTRRRRRQRKQRKTRKA